MKKGQKIRSYFLDKDERVVDHRTGHVERDARAVLDGDLDPFIERQAGIEPRIKRRIP